MDKIVVEVIHPWNGKTEDRVVFLLIGTIFLVACSLLIVLYSSRGETAATIPVDIRQTLNELTNAAEELTMLRDIEGTLPSWETILDLGMSPFTPNVLKSRPVLRWQHTGHCFMATVENPNTDFQDIELYQLKLEVFEKDSPNNIPYSIHWRNLTSAGRDTSYHAGCQSNSQKANSPVNHHQDKHTSIHDHSRRANDSDNNWHLFTGLKEYRSNNPD